MFKIYTIRLISIYLSLYTKQIINNNNNMENYRYVKWNNGGNVMKKSPRQIIDMREKNMELEIVNKCDGIIEAENKREICSKRLFERHHVIQSNKNPFLSNNNYLEDINNEMTYLRPIDSNHQNS